MVLALSACCLILIDIYMEFPEDILNRFQVTERTRFCDGQSSKENNSKNIKARARCLLLVNIYMKFREDSLNGFKLWRGQDFVTYRQTDRQTPGGKQYVSLPKEWRYNYPRIIIKCSALLSPL